METVETALEVLIVLGLVIMAIGFVVTVTMINAKPSNNAQSEIPAHVG